MTLLADELHAEALNLTRTLLHLKSITAALDTRAAAFTGMDTTLATAIATEIRIHNRDLDTVSRRLDTAIGTLSRAWPHSYAEREKAKALLSGSFPPAPDPLLLGIAAYNEHLEHRGDAFADRTRHANPSQARLCAELSAIGDRLRGIARQLSLLTSTFNQRAERALTADMLGA